MARTKRKIWLGADESEIVHAVRTAVAAVASLLIARLFHLPEAYWAAITTIIIMQSTLGAAWTLSKQRLAGTAMGATAGGLLSTYVSSNVAAFGAGVFLLGVICALVHVERNAYRYAGITLAIVMLVAHTQPAWIIAVHRFIEISIGIAVGLILTLLWKPPQPAVAD